MTDLKVPKILAPVNHTNYRQFDTLSSGKALFLFEHSPNENFSVFRTPFQLSMGNWGLSLEVKGDRMQNVGWYVREYCGKSKDLSGHFSEELIRERLKDKSRRVYEVKCEQTFATLSTGLSEKDTYFLLGLEEERLRHAFYFGASKLLDSLKSQGFSRHEIIKLGDFCYEDFTTSKHSEKSQEIGQEADAMFI